MTIVGQEAEKPNKGSQETAPRRASRFGVGARLTLALTAAIISTTVALGVAVENVVRTNTHASYADRAHQTTVLFASTIGGAVRFQKEDVLLEAFEALSASSNGEIESISVYTAEGAPILAQPSDMARPVAAEAVAAAIASGAPVPFADGLGQVVPVAFGRELETIGAVAVHWSSAPIERKLSSTMWAVAAVGGVLALLASAAGGVYLSRALSRPLRSLSTSVAELVAGRQVDLREATRSDEVGALARALGQIHEAGVAAQRIRRALDASAALIVATDDDRRIVFKNAALESVLSSLGRGDALQVGAELEEALVALGNYDGVAASESGGDGSLAVGDKRFRLRGQPIRNDDGSFAGVALEARDVTEEESVLGRIDAIVQAAQQGDFDGRIGAENVAGALGDAGRKIDDLVAGVDSGLRAANEAIASLARGDLTASMAGDFEGGFAELQSNLNTSINRISDLVQQMQSVAGTISSGSGQILSYTDDLAGRAENQAAALEETSATMSEISAATKDAADLAAEATRDSTEARARAESRGKVVGESVEAMRRIEESSGRISEIISVIDSIAFQTNLLALNAAVEAARAGDAGKGFAVVASEVRTLAQRAADAANDIKALINESSSHVSDGVKLVEQTGEALGEIIGAAQRMAGALEQISSATSEQSTGFSEVSSAVRNLDEITQANASAADQTASETRTLKMESDRLAELVAYFSTEAARVDAAA